MSEDMRELQSCHHSDLAQIFRQTFYNWPMKDYSVTRSLPSLAMAEYWRSQYPHLDIIGTQWMSRLQEDTLLNQHQYSLPPADVSPAGPPSFVEYEGHEVWKGHTPRVAFYH